MVHRVAWSPTHVAWVEATSPGKVTIEEYNENPKRPGTYSQRTVGVGAYQYIHFKDLAKPRR